MTRSTEPRTAPELVEVLDDMAAALGYLLDRDLLVAVTRPDRRPDPVDAFDLSKLIITPDVDGTVGVWTTDTPFPDPRPLSERDLIRLVWQLAEDEGGIRIFATNEQCRAWLAREGDPT